MILAWASPFKVFCLTRTALMSAIVFLRFFNRPTCLTILLNRLMSEININFTNMHNFQSVEIDDRGSETQLQALENDTAE